MLHFSTSLSNISIHKKEEDSNLSPPPLSLHYTFSSKHIGRALAAAELLKPECNDGDTILLNYSINNSPWTPNIKASWMSLRKVVDTFIMEEKYDVPLQQMPRNWTFCVCDFGLPDFERLDAMVH